MPSDAYMVAKVPGYTRKAGIAMNMEMPVPGTGGRHRMTESYATPPDLTLTPRQALAAKVWDVRSIYQSQGYDVNEQGVIVFTNGNAIYQLNPDGHKQQLVSESMIEQVFFVSISEPTGIAG